jgi:TolA-binding protein
MAMPRSGLVLSLFLLACGSRAATSGGGTTPADRPAAGAAAEGEGSNVIELEPLRIDVTPGKPGARAYDARTLLEEGNDALLMKDWDAAIAAYDHLVTDFPDSKLVPAAHYNAGLALEGKGDFAGAADRYRKVIALTPPQADTWTRTTAWGPSWPRPGSTSRP